MEKQSLRTYLADVEKTRPNDILTIKSPIDRDFTLMAMATELDNTPAPPLIRTEVTGYDIPVVANLFANRERIAAMLGCRKVSEISPRWAEIEKNSLCPVMVEGGPVQEIVQLGEQIDAGSLPLMQYFPTDAGRYISSGIVVAKDPETGVRNLSYHRLQYKDKNKFGVSLHSRQHLFQAYQKAEALNQPLEVAVIVGAHPAVLLAAAAKPGAEVDEYDIAGAILGSPLELVSGKTVAVEYPAWAEIVLEGHILPSVREPEGPFGEFTGYSTSRSTENVFQVTALCRREKPIYTVVIPGSAGDHLYLARVAREAAIFQRLKERIPWVREIAYPRSGVNFHCYISLDRGPQGIPKQALTLLLGLDHYVKLAIAVDADIDINKDSEVLWALATRARMTRDQFIIPQAFTISLDPSSEENMTDKVGIDATWTEKLLTEVMVCRSDEEQVIKARALIKETKGG